MSEFKLVYLSGRPLDIHANHIVAVITQRDEALRLPYLLTYYRRLGADRFLVIDNGSTDGSRDMLLAQPDTLVFWTEDSYAASSFGMDWVNTLLNHFCDGNWVLVADADECLVWPDCESQTLRQLTLWMDSIGAEALFTMMLEMYSDRAFGTIGYTAGESFLAYAPFFDRHGYVLAPFNAFPHCRILGGIRQRMYRDLPNSAGNFPTISKLPLIHWRRGQAFTGSTHFIRQPVRLAPMRGALLHFKMLDDLYEESRIEAVREQGFNKSAAAKLLIASIERNSHQSFYDPSISLKYIDTNQLVMLGLMSRDSAFAAANIRS
ncbi:MAG TPA: glycosyltransferase family 2 protein [Stellaceae bacterium]|nr:glycosyltransferase family 2 protein [Stellaceae bacterium]